MNKSIHTPPLLASLRFAFKSNNSIIREKPLNDNSLAFLTTARIYAKLYALFIALLLLSPIVAQAEIAGITTGAQLQTEAEKRIKVISTEDLKKALDDDLEMVLIDIRLPTEIKNIGGAIKADQNRNIPRGWLEHRITRAALNKDTPIVVYCSAGARSPLAADTLQKMGYTNVKNYSAGYLGWKEAGLPTAQ